MVVETIATIGNSILNNDPQLTETYFLEYGIDELIEIIDSNILKRNEMMYLFYCFVSNTVNSHLRVLMKLKEKIVSKDSLYYCLSKLIVYESDLLNLDFFYFENAAKGLMHASPITKAKCVSILSSLSKTSIEMILPLLSKL